MHSANIKEIAPLHFQVINMSVEDLKQEVATLKAIVADQKKIDSLVDELEKIESKNDYELTHKCAFTDKGMIDDCGIEVAGYGSNRPAIIYIQKCK